MLQISTLYDAKLWSILEECESKLLSEDPAAVGQNQKKIINKQDILNTIEN